MKIDYYEKIHGNSISLMEFRFRIEYGDENGPSSQVKSRNIYLKSDYLYNMVTQAPKRFFFRLTYIKYHSHIYHNNFNMLYNTKIKL